jgi:hypothetical protein
VSDPDTDTADTLNAALSAGLHLVISPGIYTLSAPLVVEKENQVLLGLGLATLICPPSGNACIQVADVSGARVAGVLLQAGKYVRLRAAPTTSFSCAKEWAGGDNLLPFVRARPTDANNLPRLLRSPRSQSPSPALARDRPTDANPPPPPLSCARFARTRRYSTAAMLQVGTPGGGFKGDPENPAVLTDVFARVGGPDTGVGPVGSMVSVDMGNVIIDNTWLWRADHTDGGGGDDALVKGGDNACKNGLVVNGDSVFAYGLAAEHTTESNVVWNGDDGTVFFYQAEIMYVSYQRINGGGSSNLTSRSAGTTGPTATGRTPATSSGRASPGTRPGASAATATSGTAPAPAARRASTARAGWRRAGSSSRTPCPST